MKKISLQTTVQELLDDLNQAVEVLKGHKFQGGYGILNNMITAVLEQNFQFPKDYGLRDWGLCYQYSNYDFLRVIAYDTDLKEDKRYAKSFGEQRGTINGVYFMVAPTYYNHNKRQSVEFPPHNEGWTLEQLMLNRRMFMMEQDMEATKEWIAEKEKSLKQTKASLKTKQKEYRNLQKSFVEAAQNHPDIYLPH